MTIYRIDSRDHKLKTMTPQQFYGEGYSAATAPLALTTAYSASVWAFRCIQLRAQTIGGLPLEVYSRETGELWPEHPLNLLFGDEDSDLLARLEIALCLWGTAYLEITKAVLGGARGLRWLNPGAMALLKTAKGIEKYIYTPASGAPARDFGRNDIVYLHTFHPTDDLDGLSPLAVALTAVGVDQRIARYAQSFFGNGARIEGILTVPGAGDEQVDLLEAKWKATFRGVGKWFKTLIFGAADVKYQPLSYPPEDLALETLSAEMRRTICAAFGVPPILAGAWEASNYATAKEQRQSFYTETILPELDFIEDELNKQFVRRFYPEAYIAFDVSGVNALREDEQTRNQALTTAVGGGWMTINEARARVGLPDVAGGDVLLPAPGTAPIQTGGSGALEVAPDPGFFRQSAARSARYP